VKPDVKVGFFIRRDVTEEKKMWNTLEESEAFYRVLFDASPIGQLVHVDGKIVYANAAALETLGAGSLDELRTVSAYDLVTTWRDKPIKCVPSGNKLQHYGYLTRLNGGFVPCIITATTIPYDGEQARLVTFIDTTEAHTAVQQLEASEARARENEEKYRTLVEASPIAIIVHQDGFIRYTNPAGVKLVGGNDISDIIGQPADKFIHPDNAAVVRERMKAAPTTMLEPMEEKFLRLDGKAIDVEVIAFPIKYEDRPAAQVVLQDITERKRAEEIIRFMAFHDPLTKLPNRTIFRERLEEALLARKDNEVIAVMLLDFDRFKQINDTLGHSVGDEVLIMVTERLRSCVFPKGVICRIGGDEFTIMIPNIPSRRHVEEIAETIKAAFNQPLIVGKDKFYLTASIGVALAPDHGNTGKSLLRSADIAMYAAKEQGKNKYQFYTNELNEAYTKRLEIESALRVAIQNGELDVFYQPIIDVKTKAVASVEALVRWNRPGYGMVSPQDFIPVAEDTGLISPIGEWVMRAVCGQIKTWKNLGYKPVPVAINVSGREFLQNDFVQKLIEVTQETGIDPSLLEVEITESTIVCDVKRTIDTLQQLKSFGIKSAIDDFGTGYSSLSYLKDFPVDKLKVDRSFTLDMNPKNVSIVRAILAIAQNLHLSVVAEGIEDSAQFNQLCEEGCDFIQGYVFSEPIPAHQFEQKFLKKTSESAAI
jgi:diguanylate cyclase (GGDEF)-like protein/PAS domain S-box-containing protein